MSKDSKLYVVFDTNMFLHVEMFTNLKWEEILKSKRNWGFLIPFTVVQEIDSKKYNQRSSIIKRAKSLISKFDEIDKNGSINNIICKILTNPINWNEIDTLFPNFNILNLEKTDNDTKILMEILQFSINNPQAEIILYTNDFSMSMMAKKYNIQCHRCMDDNNFPKIENKNKKLILEEKKPKLHILFDDYKQEKRIKKEITKFSGKIDLIEPKEETKIDYNEDSPLSGLYKTMEVIGNLQFRDIDLDNKNIQEYNAKIEELAYFGK